MKRPAPSDDELAAVLAAAGSALAPAEVRALIDGVVAAPAGFEADAWMRLVAPEADAALASALRALEAQAREARDTGLGPGPAPGERLAALRAELARRKLAGFIVPRADAHHSEYIPERAERLRWLTGFSGSAGIAVVLADKAAVFVDGRYTLQVELEVDNDLFERRHVTDDPPHDWVAKHLGKGGRLGYDPWLHTPDGLARYREACARAGGELIACADNPIDAIWDEQPLPPLAPVVPHETRFAGREAAEKRGEIARSLREAGAGACVVSTPDSVAWLLNLRGGDVAYSPFPLAFALIDDKARVELFCDKRKLAPEIAQHLGPEVAVRGADELGPALDQLAKGEKPVQADPASTSAWVFERIAAAGGEVRRAADPCAIPKACKNDVELAGARAAHRRDGAALTRFLCWFARTAPEGGLTEMTAAERLYALRAENEHYRGPSFPTIAGAGPNGAIVHYRVSDKTNRTVEPGALFLVDSGGQYLDGTTDVTRTLAVGAPSAEQRRRFTAVLKGHIALATTHFPAGTTGSQLDVLARHALWQMGLDFDHGTGHGVGSYLGVHEGPQRISKLPNSVALRPGMIVSNEPGYYKAGEYGIRIENLVCVVALPREEEHERDLLAFETLTKAPIDRALIVPAMLTEDEAAWLDAYHADVRASLTPLVDAATADWLAAATRPLGEG
ncbi:MAG: aminopeptidase P family protein [Alphaproteobacteria bacterium]